MANDYNHPIAMIINGNLKFEFYLNRNTRVTDLLSNKIYRIDPDHTHQMPFVLTLVYEE
jgi:hypothetical protein